MHVPGEHRWCVEFGERCERLSAAFFALLVHGVLFTLILGGHPSFDDIDRSSGVAGGEANLRIRWIGIAPSTDVGQALPAQKASPAASSVSSEAAVLDSPAEPRSIVAQQSGIDEADRPAAATEVRVETADEAVGGGESDAPAMDAYEDLRAVYLNALRGTVRMHWARVENAAPLPGNCELTIQQGRQGQIESVGVGVCALTARQKRLLERAVHDAQTLPFAGFESVAEPKIHLRM